MTGLPGAAPSTTGSRSRESWVDVAKGIAIILVVLFHSIIFTDRIGVAWEWPVPAGILDTFRMPLFFFTAGLFAQRALRLPFAALFSSRLLRLFWLYVLWSLIWAVAFTFIPVPGEADAVPPLLEFALLLVWPNASTWFVYGLAIYFILAWALRSLPAWVQLTFALAIALLFGTQTINAGNGALDKMGMYFVYFLIAALFGPAMRAVFARARWWHLLIAVGAYSVAVIPVAKFGYLNVPFVRVALSLLAILTGCCAAVVLARLSWFAWLRYLGGRTLPIYLLHFYPILIAVTLCAPIAPVLVPAAPFIPPVLTAAAILICLGVYRVTRGVPGLYSPPAAVVSFVNKRTQGSVGAP